MSEDELSEVVLALSRAFQAQRDLAVARSAQQDADKKLQDLRHVYEQLQRNYRFDLEAKNERIDLLQAKLRHQVHVAGPATPHPSADDMLE